MSIPMEPVTVKFPPAEIFSLRKQAESQGFEGISDYVRHLVSQDREALHKRWLALEPIFGAGAANSKEPLVGQRRTDV